MQLPARYPICLLLGYALYAAEPDQAISLALRRAVADVHHVRVWYRASVDSDLDLVIALGSPANWPPGSGKADWWSDKRALGLFLQRRDQPALIYQIAAEKGSADADCYALIERATATDVVISCTPEKGRRGPNRKFVYDIRAKALVKRIDYAPFAMSRVFVSDDGAVLVGSDYTRLVAVEYRPARASPFRVLTGAEAVQWTGRVRTTASTVGVGAGLRNEIYIEPETFKPVHFGAGNRFTLTQEEKTSLLVLEQTPQHLERFPLPQLSYEEFARARPQRVKDG